jgi:tetratricopeptide (TPR) repeat protein
MHRFITAFFIITLLCGIASAQTASSGGWDATAGWGDKRPLSAEGYTYEGMLAIGHAIYKTGKYPEAIVQYEKARALAMERPYAYYFIAAAQSRLKQFNEATASLRTAVTLAGAIDVAFASKCLYFLAVTLERAGDLEQAKFAWAEYLNSAGAHMFPHKAIAEAHIAAIEKKIQHDQQYQIVKDRAGNTSR